MLYYSYIIVITDVTMELLPGHIIFKMPTSGKQL